MRAASSTVTVDVLLSLPATVSGLVVVTVAVFESEPGVFGVTVSVIVTDADAASVPMVQVTVDVPLQEPCDVVTEPKVTLPGRTSVIVTPKAVEGPLFVTTMFQVSGRPFA